MKTNIILILILVAQFLKAQDLFPDQNPNYMKSMEKYMVNKDDLIKNEGKTIQSTYKAIDDMQIRAERKALRRSYRQERRLARINNRGYYNPFYYYPYNNGIGYNFNPYVYNYGYNYPTYGYTPYCGLNTITNTALLGLGLYWWLK